MNLGKLSIVIAKLYMPVSLVSIYIYVCEIYDKWDPWEVNGYKMETLFVLFISAIWSYNSLINRGIEAIMRITYLVETENFLLKVLSDSGIVPKNVTRLMNNNKDKLKTLITFNFHHFPNAL